MKNCNKIYLLIVIMIFMIFAGTAHADETPHKKLNVDAQISAGLVTVLNFQIDYITTPSVIRLSFDIGKFFRIQAGVSYYFLLHTALDLGVSLKPVGKNAEISGGGQIRIPLMLSAGYATRNHEDQENINWITLGPKSGIDFIWWKANSAGFCLSVDLSYYLKIDFGPDKTDISEDAGFTQLFILWGVII